MSVREGMKSLLKEAVNLAQWLRLSFNDDIEIGRKTKVRGAKLSRYVKIGAKCNISGGVVNSYSYMGDYCELPQVEIGKYCSIASHVKLAAGNHPMDYVSTSPYTYSPIRNSFAKEQLFKNEFFYTDERKKLLCKVGNDVWIGTGAMLVCGSKALNIGDGAVIAAGAVVTKDVPPYAIVAGCPAQILRYRFSDDMITKLEDEKWWDKDENWMKGSVEYFPKPDRLFDREER